MFDKELTEKICDLTCSKEEVARNQTTIKYDIDHPFRKYYSINIIVKAIQKYECGEWDAQTLANWACIYNWIICGGFYDNVLEELDEFENLIKDIICWDLDSLSFVDCGEDVIPSKLIEGFTNLDFILKTKDEWKFYCAYVGKFDKHNHDPYVLLVNEKEKKYMIAYGVDGFCFIEKQHFIKREDFIKYIDQLNQEKYVILSYSEDFFYENIK